MILRISKNKLKTIYFNTGTDDWEYGLMIAAWPYAWLTHYYSIISNSNPNISGICSICGWIMDSIMVAGNIQLGWVAI